MRSILPNFRFRSKNRLTNINILGHDIISIINNLNPRKAHGCDGILIQMIKPCPLEIAKTHLLIYKRCIEDGYFPKMWKKANVQPVHKKQADKLKLIIGPFHCCLYVDKFWKRLYLTICMHFYRKRTNY